MRKLFLALLLAFAGTMSYAQGIGLSAHSTVNSPTDSDHGLSSIVIGNADCDIVSPSGCTVPAADGPFRGTFIVSSSVSLTADRCLILPISPGRAVYVKNNTLGGKNVCVKATTGSSAVFANGQSGVAFSDTSGYNVISTSNGGSTSALGLVIADGVTYATIQAAYTAACAPATNLNVYVPANSTVTDTVDNTPNYMTPTCTTQVVDDRAGKTFGSRGNNFFQPTTQRKDYYPREGTIKSHWIDLLNNGVTPSITGIPSLVQWAVRFHGDSVSAFATFYSIMQQSFGLGVAGYFTSTAHTGGANNEGFYGLGQGSINLNSGTSGSVTLSPNGAPDPTTPNGSSLILGSSSTTGTLTFNLVSAQMGTDTRQRNMQQASVFYLCDGKPSTINIQTSSDGLNYFNETLSSTQPSSCAATGGIVAVGVLGVGSGSGCGTLTLGATGGTGFVGTAFPNSLGQIDHVTVTSQGSGYNPYTSTITVTGGSCTGSLPTWGNLLTSNISIQEARVTHDGIGYVKVTNSGDAVKIVGFGLYNPNQSGIVIEDMGFGGSSYDSLFAAPDSYTAPWYNGMPIPDTTYVQYFDNRTEAGNGIETYFQKDYDRTNAQHVTKAATYGTSTACNAAGYGWDTQCRAYTADLVWVDAYQAGNTSTVNAVGPLDQAIMAQVNQINRGVSGNAMFLDVGFAQPNSHDGLTRLLFGVSDPTTHIGPGGRALLNSIAQQVGGIPPQDLFATKAFTAIEVGQGSVTAPSVKFTRTGGVGLYFDPALHQITALGGIISKGALVTQPDTLTTPTVYIPPAAVGSTSASYMICAAGGGNLNPSGCSPVVNVTTGPATLSATNYIQICLPRPILGAFYYSLIRTAGYSGPIVVYDTALYTNTKTNPCMYDTGGAGTVYTASKWNPSGYLVVNSPATPIDFGTVAGFKTPDNNYNVYFAQGSVLGGTGAWRIKTQDAANGANYCSFDIMTNGWSHAFQCGNTHGNDRVLSLQPFNFQVTATNNPNMDFAFSTGFMTGTVPIFRIKANSSSGACPSGGCGIFVSPDSSFAGYLALFSDSLNNRLWGLKQTGLELFGRSTLLTGVQGTTGTKLLSALGTFTSGHIVGIDSNLNAVDTTVLPNGTTATTQTSADSSTLVATTAYVQNAINNGLISTNVSTTISPAVFATGTMLGHVFYTTYVGTTGPLITARLEGSISCTVAPTINLMDLGTSPSTVYGSATTVQTLFTGTSDGVYQASGVTPTVSGHYYGIAISSGTCATAPTIDVSIYWTW